MLADGGQERIPLQTNKGLIGYRVVKFQIVSAKPGTTTAEHVVQIWKVEQATVPTTSPAIDFSSQTLLGIAIAGNSTNISAPSDPGPIIFDNEIFNQDIYVTHTEAHAAEECNYYIELEQMDLALDEATVATLKDIRNND